MGDIFAYNRSYSDGPKNFALLFSVQLVGIRI